MSKVYQIQQSTAKPKRN